MQITNLSPKCFNLGSYKMFCNIKNLFLFLIGPYDITLGSLLLLFRIFHNLKYISQQSWKEGRGSGFWWRVGNGRRRQGKALFLSDTLKLKNTQQSRHPLPALQFSTYKSHCGLVVFFFCRSKRNFSHAVAPLTSYKWSKLHRYMKNHTV